MGKSWKNQKEIIGKSKENRGKIKGKCGWLIIFVSFIAFAYKGRPK